MLTRKQIRILVTDGTELAALGAVRSLGRAGYTVIAGSVAAAAPVTWSRFCSQVITHPDPWEHTLEFCQWLDDQVRMDAFDVLLPVSEAAMVAAAEVRRGTGRKKTFLLPTDEALAICLSKYRSTALAMRLGIVCPQTVFVRGYEEPDWNGDVSALGFPVIIKTDNHFDEHHRRYFKGRGVVVQDAATAEDVLAKLRGSDQAVLAQSFVPGHGEGAFLLRVNGQTQLTFTHTRRHEVPYYGGWSSLRESTRNHRIVEIAEYLLSQAGFDGAGMVEFRVGADGVPYFLEINGRLWGSLALALHAGVDFPCALADAYTGVGGVRQSVPGHYKVGIKCRNLFPGELLHVASVFRLRTPNRGSRPPSRVKTLFSFFALSLNPAVRHDYFWWSDPLPAIKQAASTIGTFLGLFVKKLHHKFQRGKNQRTLRRLALPFQIRNRTMPLSRKTGKVVFVCYGNICRSPFAEKLWNRLVTESGNRLPVAISRGLVPSVNPAPAWIVELAHEHQVDLANNQPKELTAEDVADADIIFVMEVDHHQKLLARFPYAKAKAHLLGSLLEPACELPDPLFMRRSEARRWFERLHLAVQALIDFYTGTETVPAAAGVASVRQERTETPVLLQTSPTARLTENCRRD